MGDKVGCKACSGTGWIYLEREKGQPVVRPCTCRYEIAKKITMNEEESKSLNDIQSRKAAEEIVRAYERHREKEKSK